MAAPVSSVVAQLERVAHVLSHQSPQSAWAAAVSVGLVALHPPTLGVTVAAEPSGGAAKVVRVRVRVRVNHLRRRGHDVDGHAGRRLGHYAAAGHARIGHLVGVRVRGGIRVRLRVG
eukprot:scaffold54428_cov55-Phaeocystis_antarctica.AAC.1